MKSAVRECTKYIRRAQRALGGQRLAVDEVTSLILVRQQLDEAIMKAGEGALGQLEAEEKAAKRAASERAFDEHNAKLHLKSVPAETADAT